MANEIKKAREVLASEGPKSLLAKTHEYLRTRLRKLYWRLRRTRPVTLNDTTATFSTRGRSAHTIEYLLNSGEATLVEDMISEARHDDVFWDVGAMIGFHSAFVGQHVDKTIAFEPVPVTADELAQNLARNGVGATVRPHALSDDGGDLAITGETAPQIPAGDTITRPVHTGASLLQNGTLPAPTMLKIDVEGAEGTVLEGLGGALGGCRVVYVEVHRPVDGRLSVEDFGYTVEDIRGLLSDAGFSVSEFARRQGELHFKATR